MKLKLAMLFLLGGCIFLKAQTNESLYVKYVFMNNHTIEVSDSGLSASRSYFVHKRFRNKLERQKLFIPKSELDSLAFYRLDLFLQLSQCLANVPSIEEEPLQTPDSFYVSCSDNSDTVLITDNSRNVIAGLAYSQYMLNELRMLINDLIPEKYSDLNLNIIYKPRAEDIIESR